MTLLLDDRIGSYDLEPRLKARGIPCQLTRLPFGDASWVGRGPEERPILCGVEIKRLGDLIQSRDSGRLAGHQLVGMQRAFEQYWLLLQDPFRPGQDGQVEVKQGEQWVAYPGRGLMYRDLMGYLTSLSVLGGCRLLRTWDRRETAQVIGDLYVWWTIKSFEEHRSLCAFDDSPQAEVSLLVKPSTARLVAAQLPGIGWIKSLRVVQRFGSVSGMVDASIKEWQEIEGVGKVLAKRIFDALRERGA